MNRSSYGKKGLYSGYDKNNKEREALDYYATPPKEVTNILNILQLNLKKQVILEPAAGGGHMMQGILAYEPEAKIVASDIQERAHDDNLLIMSGKEFDFLSDEYPLTQDIDYVIMNPPFSVIEGFCMKSLGLAKKGVLMFGRLQFIEGQSRFNKIFSECPPTDIYAYVERINCFKNGDFNIPQAGVQAYAWFYWDFTKPYTQTIMHWIHKEGKA